MTQKAKQHFFCVENAVKRFGALTAIDHVSFDLAQGEILGIAGPNGSGKSTLFNIITSVPFPSDQGQVIFEGCDITRMVPNRICKRGLARTFQRESVFPGLSAFDNVMVAIEHGRNAGNRQKNEDKTEDVLNFVGFPRNMHNTFAGALPLFNRKQLMIATALALSPRLLLLDEPASSLTKPEIQKLTDIILRINAKGISLLLIEHVLSLLTAVSQRLLVLDHGKLICMGKPETVTKDPGVIEAYLGTQRGKHDKATA